MHTGFYSPAFRMIAGQVDQLDAISENLANSNTPGYKQLVVSHKRFETLLNDAMGRTATLDAREFDPIAVNFGNGAIRATERPLDFAINGPGFFVVERDGKEIYTRKGDFHMAPDGSLVNSDNFPVMGPDGPISFPAETSMSQISADETGALRIGGTPAGALKIVTFEDPGRLTRVGTTLFDAPAGLEPEEATGETRVVHAALEQSNSSIFEEMVAMINCMRSFEACQRMLRTRDENDGKMIQQLGS